MQKFSPHLYSLNRVLKHGRWRRQLSISTQPAKTEEKEETNEKIVAAVVFERLPVILPKLKPPQAAFKEFSFQWRQQYRRQYPDEFFQRSASKGKDDAQVDYIPAPRVTEADKSNDRRSLKRALDRRLYLIMHGTPYGAPKDKPVWHFPEKLYTNEETLRKCAESALKSVIGGLSNCYFVGNAPCAHIAVQSKQSGDEDPSYFKQFFFRSQVIASQSYKVSKCDDYVWVTKDELLEYFDPEQQPFLQKMLIH